jgi:hypothetical protein
MHREYDDASHGFVSRTADAVPKNTGYCIKAAEPQPKIISLALSLLRKMRERVRENHTISMLKTKKSRWKTLKPPY